jgi:DDE superfamily endonuclease
LQHRQQINRNSQNKRVEHAQAILDLIEEDEDFLGRLMFSDEAHFHLHGRINHQCFRYWSETNPHWYRSEPLFSPKIGVWAAIGKKGMVGPIFFEGTMDADRYLELLQDFFVPAVEQWQENDEIIFMEDGAPYHSWSIEVRQWLNENFEDRWMGRGGRSDPPPYSWPPYSPDLTPLDFFLWGYVKSKVYRTLPANLEELKERISRVFAEIPQEMIDRAIDAYQSRLERCIEVQGRSVEQSYEADNIAASHE